MNWIYRTAGEQRAALARGEISSLELLEATIEHSDAMAPHINPFALTLYDRAREMALEADKAMARGKGGPLCGIPVTIKDSQWLAGVPCANGSLSLKEFVPDQTSQSVQRLEDAGAVIFAKTTCPEFSLTGITHSEFYGLTSNPRNIERTSGGSSGSPVLSSVTNKVIALHHCANCPNRGTPILDVYNDIQASANPLPGCSTSQCNPTGVPQGLVATTPQPNEIQLDWQPVVDAALYRVYRSTASCDSGMTEIATTTMVSSSATSRWSSMRSGNARRANDRRHCGRSTSRSKCASMARCRVASAATASPTRSSDVR